MRLLHHQFADSVCNVLCQHLHTEYLPLINVPASNKRLLTQHKLDLKDLASFPVCLQYGNEVRTRPSPWVGHAAVETLTFSPLSPEWLQLEFLSARETSKVSLSMQTSEYQARGKVTMTTAHHSNITTSTLTTTFHGHGCWQFKSLHFLSGHLM